MTTGAAAQANSHMWLVPFAASFVVSVEILAVFGIQGVLGGVAAVILTITAFAAWTALALMWRRLAEVLEP